MSDNVVVEPPEAHLDAGTAHGGASELEGSAGLSKTRLHDEQPQTASALGCSCRHEGLRQSVEQELRKAGAIVVHRDDAPGAGDPVVYLDQPIALTGQRMQCIHQEVGKHLQQQG